MHIASSAFDHNQNIPEKYTCDGEGISPPLSFSEVPEDAKSLVLINDDPDAPGETWVHWIVWNISPKTEEVDEAATPEGAREGVTSFGKHGYGGPCPPASPAKRGEPSGTHRYFFKLYALDTELDIPEDADKFELEEAMDGHIIEEAEMIGLYSRD